MSHAFFHLEAHRTPYHHLRQAVFVGAFWDGFTDHRAAPDDQDAVGHIQHFAQLVGNKDDRLSLMIQLAHDPEQLIRFLRGEHRGRLIKDEDIRLAVEQLDDLHALLHAHRQVAHVSVRVNFQLVALGNVADTRGCPGAVEETARAHLLGPQHDIFGDGENRDEHESAGAPCQFPCGSRPWAIG